MQFVAVITEEKNESILIVTISLECFNDLPHMIVGSKQAIIVVSYLLTHKCGVWIIRGTRYLGAVDNLLRSLS